MDSEGQGTGDRSWGLRRGPQPRLHLTHMTQKTESSHIPGISTHFRLSSLQNQPSFGPAIDTILCYKQREGSDEAGFGSTRGAAGTPSSLAAPLEGHRKGMGTLSHGVRQCPWSTPGGCFAGGFSGPLRSLQGSWGSLFKLHSFWHLLLQVHSNPGLSPPCLPDTCQVLSPVNIFPSVLLPAQGHFSFPGQTHPISKWGFSPFNPFFWPRAHS